MTRNERLARLRKFTEEQRKEFATHWRLWARGQQLGDDAQASFPLVKHYGETGTLQTRRITRPRFETLLVSIDGVLEVGTWSLDEGGILTFASPVAAGTEVRAGFLFDVAVRFAEDRLEISGAAFAAGEAPSVPTVEIREAA